jgi:hypothetical protein
LIFRSFLGGEFLQNIEVGNSSFQSLKRVDFSTQSRDFSDFALGAFAVVPESRIGHAGLDFR